jgi:pyruvate,water dikinase
MCRTRCATALAQAYGRLGAAAVAVRSSATSEDTGSTSFAGMHETFTNVVGEAALLERLVDCWVSAYGARVLAYRKAEGMTTRSRRSPWSCSGWSTRRARA